MRKIHRARDIISHQPMIFTLLKTYHRWMKEKTTNKKWLQRVITSLEPFFETGVCFRPILCLIRPINTLNRELSNRRSHRSIILSDRSISKGHRSILCLDRSIIFNRRSIPTLICVHIVMISLLNMYNSIKVLIFSNF